MFICSSGVWRYLPDKPTPLIDVEQNADGQDSGPPVAGSSGKKQKSRNRKRISWAQLLKRTTPLDSMLTSQYKDSRFGLNIPKKFDEFEAVTGLTNTAMRQH